MLGVFGYGCVRVFCSFFFFFELHTDGIAIAEVTLIQYSALFQQSTRGAVTGVGESLCAFASAVAPIVGTPLFAWSESSGE